MNLHLSTARRTPFGGLVNAFTNAPRPRGAGLFTAVGARAGRTWGALCKTPGSWTGAPRGAVGRGLSSPNGARRPYVVGARPGPWWAHRGSEGLGRSRNDEMEEK